MSVRITGIRKPGGAQNPHEAITHYQWLNESTSEMGISIRQIMVDWVDGGGRAYVKDAAGTVDCRVNVSRASTKFLQTYADNRWTDNLLSLPDC